MQNRLVKIKFYDHVSTKGDEHGAGALSCEIFGLLFKEDGLSYYVASWVGDGDLSSNNTEVFVILKSTVIGIVDLEEKG